MMQKNNIIYRKALPTDAGQIAEIEKECFSSPWSENQIKEETINSKAIFMAAEYENRICGYVSGQLILDEFYISNIAVSTEFRKKGTGSRLLSLLIEELKNTDCILLTLEVRESNSAARLLYEAFGFKNLGIRKNFYTLPTENACIYTLNLNSNKKE